MTLPPFDSHGMLPPGDYCLTFEQLERSRLVTGESAACRDWDADWRGTLVANLREAVRLLWQVGIERVFIGGSFVERKGRPNDIDGYFHCDIFHYASQELQRELNAIEGAPRWEWRWENRLADPKTGRPILPMKPRYHVELYPHPCLVKELAGPVCVRQDGTALFREDLLPQMARTLTAMRKASGLTLQEFGARLGQAETKISQREAADYPNLTLDEARKMTEVLAPLVDTYPALLRRSRARPPFGIRRPRGVIEILRQE